MEHGPIKYMWMRPLSIIGLFAIGCFGTLLSYFAYTDVYKELNQLLWAAGLLFILFGFGVGIGHYFNGFTYYRNSICKLEELGIFTQYDNGILVVIDNRAKLITLNYKKIVDRGYVKLHSDFDRKKKLKQWFFLNN